MCSFLFFQSTLAILFWFDNELLPSSWDVVVFHHGPEAVGGHYTCAVKTNNNMWFLCDDADIAQIHEDDVTRNYACKQAYIVAYERV